MRAPLYRVEDDESRARYFEGRGIQAEANRLVPYDPRNPWQQKYLGKELWDQLDWRNRTPTVFISTSSNKEWAFAEARRRVREGKTNVKVYEIRVPDDLERYNKRRNCRLVFKRLTKWLERAAVGMPRCAQFRSSRNEYLFLHYIPNDLIKDITDEWVRKMW